MKDEIMLALAFAVGVFFGNYAWQSFPLGGSSGS